MQQAGVRGPESWIAWLIGAVMGALFGFASALAGPILLVLAVLVIGLRYVTAHSAAYISGAAVGLAAGWLTMPLWHPSIEVMVYLGVAAALVVIGGLAGWVSLRRIARS